MYSTINRKKSRDNNLWCLVTETRGQRVVRLGYDTKKGRLSGSSKRCSGSSRDQILGSVDSHLHDLDVIDFEHMAKDDGQRFRHEIAHPIFR